MSGVQDAPTDGGAASPPPADQTELLGRARRLGWRPKEEFTGDPEKWVPADEFLDRGLSDPRILAHNLETLDRRFQRMERDNGALTAQLTQANQRAAETGDTVKQLSDMLKTADQRAYERAKRELENERKKAVEAGDTATFDRVQAEIDSLKPTAVPATTAAPAPTPTARAGYADNTPNNPAIRSFYERNPWYHQPGGTSPNYDIAMTRRADYHHAGLQAERPDLTLEQNLMETERIIRAEFPQKFGGAAPIPQPGAGDTGRPNGTGGGGDDTNSRRSDAPMVTPSGQGTGHRPPQNRFTFDAMPKDSKDAYVRYARQLEGHGEKLTREEWAHSYWLQDQAYVDLIEARGGA